MSEALAKVESWEDHVEAWHHLGRLVNESSWGRAEIAASVKGHYRENGVGKFAKEVGFSPASIYRFALTFEAFPESFQRLENLSFDHHAYAVELTNTVDDARAALELAASNGWKASKLRAHLAAPAEEETTAAAADEECDTDGGSCGAPTNRDKQFHIAGLVESLTKSMTLFEAVKGYELDPLIEHGTKKSLRELSKKADAVIEWLQSLQSTIRRRTK